MFHRFFPRANGFESKIEVAKDCSKVPAIDVLLLDWVSDFFQGSPSITKITAIKLSPTGRVYPRSASVKLFAAELPSEVVNAFIPASSYHRFDTSAIRDAAFNHAYSVHLSSNARLLNAEQPAVLAKIDVLKNQTAAFEAVDTSITCDSDTELNALVIELDCSMDEEAAFDVSFSSMRKTVLFLKKPLKVSAGTHIF